MSELNPKYGDRYKLLVSVIHDDLERFHYPGEEVKFLNFASGRIRCSAGHDTLELNSDQIKSLKG